MAAPRKLSRAGAAFILLGLSAAIAGAFTFVTNDDTGLPVKWPAKPILITIKLGTAANNSDGLSFNDSAKAAAEDWNQNLGATQFQVTTAAAGTAAQNNGVNELAFSADVFGKPFETNVLAITTSFSSGNERKSSDILFNSAISWNSYRGNTRSSIDLRRVALHELGHILGLDHPDQAGQSVSAIMRSTIGNLDSLTSDDISGAQSLYGPPGVPANNNFANPVTVDLNSGKTTATGFNTNATLENGEPRFRGENTNGGRSVWYRWRPASSGAVTIDTRGSYYDTLLAVYTGSSVSGLTSVAANDDITDGVVQASTVSFNAVGGTTYQISVDGFNGNDGNGADSGGLKLNFDFASVGGNAPSITTQPASVTVDAGNSATFSVAVTGSDPLSYQWSFNGTAISGATNSSYNIASAQSANAGTYTVTVTNGAGSVTSAGATLTLRATTPTPPPSSGGGGGGGGGAVSSWFLVALAGLACARCWRRRS